MASADSPRQSVSAGESILPQNDGLFYGGRWHKSAAGGTIESRNPAPDLARLAEGQGAVGIGPITDIDTLAEAMREALGVVVSGGVALVDVHVVSGYDPSIAATMTRG